MQIIDLQIIKFSSTLLRTILQYDSVVCLANMLMFEKRWLHAVDERGKLVKVVVYLSRYAYETLSTKVITTTNLFICLVNYIGGERKRGTFNTQ